MKIKAFVSFFLALLLLSLPVCAESISPSELAQDIIEYKLAEASVSSVEELIEGSLSSEAGVNSEWYVMALSKMYGYYDFSAYVSSLKAYVSADNKVVASTRQRNALALIAVADDTSVGNAILDETIGAQGIMSLIFGLHLINNGCESDNHTAESVITSLLSLQLEDGGWALTGKASDVDVTAMAVAALSPYYESNELVHSTIDSAIALLSARQLENGGFKSYGVENPESACQAIIALTSLGIDIFSDDRFIKNGNTMWDNIFNFQLENGAFSHTLGGNKNGIATAQAFCAATALTLFENNDVPFYIFTDTAELTATPSPTESAVPTQAPSVTPTVSVTDTPSPTNEPSATSTLTPTPAQTADENNIPSYKIIAAAVILCAAVMACIVLVALKKGKGKNFTFIAVIALILLALLFLTDFRSTESFYGNIDEKTDSIGTVTMSISCDKLIGKTDAEHIPADGVILAATELSIKQGDTVYDILIDAARKYSIQTDCTGIISGSSELAYVSGIAHIYELEFGDLSGWIFKVNGKSASVGCGAYELNDGDVIEWHYTLELGNDIK